MAAKLTLGWVRNHFEGEIKNLQEYNFKIQEFPFTAQ
jgi:hypothetical protein